MDYEIIERPNYFTNRTGICIKWEDSQGKLILRHAVEIKHPFSLERRQEIVEELHKQTTKYINFKKEKTNLRFWFADRWQRILLTIRK